MSGVIELLGVVIALLWVLLLFGCGFCYGMLRGFRWRSRDFDRAEESRHRLRLWLAETIAENAELRKIVVRLDPYRDLPRMRSKNVRYARKVGET